MGFSAPPHPPGTGRRAGRGPSDHGHVRRPPRSPTCRGSEAFRMVQTSTPGGDPKCTEPEAPALAALPGRALSSPGCSSSDGAEPVTSGQTGSGPREAGASNTRALPAGGGVRGSVTGRVRAKSLVGVGRPGESEGETPDKRAGLPNTGRKTRFGPESDAQGLVFMESPLVSSL